MRTERDRDKVRKTVFQFIKFGIVGVSNTLINYAVYFVLVSLGVHYLAGNAVGFFVSVANAFYWNNRVVFRRQEGRGRNLLHAFVKSLVSYSFSSLFLTSVLLYLWVDCLQISPYLAAIINLAITVPLNFVLNKFWAFK